MVIDASHAVVVQAFIYFWNDTCPSEQTQLKIIQFNDLCVHVATRTVYENCFLINPNIVNFQIYDTMDRPLQGNPPVLKVEDFYKIEEPSFEPCKLEIDQITQNTDTDTQNLRRTTRKGANVLYDVRF